MAKPENQYIYGKYQYLYGKYQYLYGKYRYFYGKYQYLYGKMINKFKHTIFSYIMIETIKTMAKLKQQYGWVDNNL